MTPIGNALARAFWILWGWFLDGYAVCVALVHAHPHAACLLIFALIFALVL